jgi:adenylosuccinate synthase
LEDVDFGLVVYEDLPENCKKYTTFIGEYLKVPIECIGVGLERGNMIRK